MRSIQTLEGQLQVVGNPQVAVIASRFNEPVVNSLIEGTLLGLKQYLPAEAIRLVKVPGAFELPFVAKSMAPYFDGCIALGAVIRGETAHFDFVAGECAHGLAQVSLEIGKPVIFGVLTTDTDEQALQRANIDADNKGLEFANNLIEMLHLLQKIKSL